ncbi:hypothetical protein PISMIDRAFT_211035 [Pisolithus microcarpus 441]|uniref:Uncharacterized protein n=1 Tax=Pisolithus microcarpus 441 TaxID=765257 RepID=A0A0C9ZD56_9AGAM|nr:hypothetical protein PISMIDRAFT_211035 [Pisolithus microcarpus 441]
MQVVKSSTATKRILLVSWAANACSKDAEHKAIQSRVGSNRSTEGQSKTGHLPHFLPFLDLYTDEIGSDIFFFVDRNNHRLPEATWRPSETGY